MREFKVKFAEKIRRTDTVISFRFLPESKIDFFPGQFLQFIFDEGNPKNKELNKYLSFSSSPNNSYIEVTKRISDSQFCSKLKNLKENDSILVKAPLGNCVFDRSYDKICFLVGGIGVTPVISILEYIGQERLPTDVILLYSNKNQEDIAFKNEIDLWQKKSSLKVFYLITDCKPRDEECIYGRIDKELFVEKVKDFKGRHIFSFGPPAMVKAMKNMCLELECENSNMHFEIFAGY